MAEQKIIQGDCLKILPTIPEKSIDIVVSDPPYCISFQSNYRTDKFDRLVGDDNTDWVEPAIKEIYRVLKDNSAFYCFTRWDVYPFWHSIISKYFTIKNLLVIKRKHTSMGDLTGSFAYSYEMCIFAMKGRREYNKISMLKAVRIDKRAINKSGVRYRFPDLIDFVDANEFNLDMVHPTQKTVDIYRLFIELHSNKGDMVIDPFCGVGTCAVACRELERNCIGIEIDEKFVNIARERLKAVPERLDRFLKDYISEK